MTPGTTHFARVLRKSSTEAEIALWRKLKARHLEGIKFRRQQPIEALIVDFVSFEKRIVIELDGGQHSKNKLEDAKRDRVLSENGFKVLRFWNNDVLKNIEGVLEVVRKACLN